MFGLLFISRHFIYVVLLSSLMFDVDVNWELRHIGSNLWAVHCDAELIVPSLRVFSDSRSATNPLTAFVPK